MINKIQTSCTSRIVAHLSLLLMLMCSFAVTPMEEKAENNSDQDVERLFDEVDKSFDVEKSMDGLVDPFVSPRENRRINLMREEISNLPREERGNLVRGRDAYLAGEYGEALKLLRPYAEDGVAGAQAILGDIYMHWLYETSEIPNVKGVPSTLIPLSSTQVPTISGVGEVSRSSTRQGLP